MASAAQPQRESPRRGSVPVRPEIDSARPRDPHLGSGHVGLPSPLLPHQATPFSPRSVAALQRQVGNRAASRLLFPSTAKGRATGQAAQPAVQRDGPVASKATWNPPHFFEDDGLIPVTDHYQARNNLEMISLTLGTVARWGYPVAQILLGRAEQTRDAMAEQGDLTQDEVDNLSNLGAAAVLACQEGTRLMLDELMSSLTQYKMPGGFDGTADEISDLLHEAFGADEDLLTKAKDLSENLHIAEENLHYITEWGEQAFAEVKMLEAEGMMAAHYLETAESTFKHVIEGAGEILPWAIAIHGAMQAIWASASAIAAAHDSSKSSAQQAAAGIEAGTSTVSALLGAGAVIGLESAAGVGLVWADLVIPETKAALEALEHTDKLCSDIARKNVPGWYDQVVNGGGPPVIPKIFLTQNWFPGGQDTLNYMWAAFQGSPPEQVPDEVTRFFYANRKKMNLEHSESDQLDTEWHLFSANEVKNLNEWITSNKQEVWGMLYGSLPHP
jgi:hypothetical protein